MARTVRSTLDRLACLLSLLCLLSPVASTAADLEKVTLVAHANANDDSPVRIDIVLVYGSEAAAVLPDESATWFAQRAELLARMGSSIDVLSFELYPTQRSRTEGLRDLRGRAKNAMSVLAYADYQNPAGQLAESLADLRCARITLAAHRMYVEDCEEQASEP